MREPLIDEGEVEDNGPIHTSKRSLAALAARAHWLTIEWLPKYAPELNDIEPVWRDLKAHHLAHQTFTDIAAPDQAMHDAVMDGLVERGDVCEGLVGEVMGLKIAPDRLDDVEFGGVFRQPPDGEPVCAGGQGGERAFAGVDRTIVLDQHDRFGLSPGLRSKETNPPVAFIG